MSDWSVLMTPQNATLDSKRTLSLFVSHRLLSPQFQFSLSAAALDMYCISMSTIYRGFIYLGCLRYQYGTVPYQ